MNTKEAMKVATEVATRREWLSVEQVALVILAREVRRLAKDNEIQAETLADVYEKFPLIASK